MFENTPPHNQNLSDDEEEGEYIALEDDHEPLDDEEYEEIDEHDLEMLLAHRDGNSDLDVDIVTAEQDDSILTLRKHVGAVFSCSFHPIRSIVATGGEDDLAYVWDRETGEVIHTILNHTDTVVGTTFSSDGNYLATGDLAGEVQVFKVTLSEMTKIWSYSMGDMCWLRWHKGANVLLAGSEAGEVFIWRIPTGQCKILPGNGFKCEASDLSADGQKLYCGYGDGTVKLWDIKNAVCLIECLSDSQSGHKNSVSVVACDIHNSLYASGCEDGKILFMSNSGPVCGVEANGAVETLAFSPFEDYKVIASGTLHGQIAIWDYSKGKLRLLCEHPEPDDGITVLKWLPNYTLIVGTIAGNIFGFDGRNGTRKFTLSGHVSEIYNISYREEENIIMSVSEDGTAKIFNCST